MKLLTSKKIERTYFSIYYSIENNSYLKKFSIRKRAWIKFLGIPIWTTKEIYVTSN